jgi:hypothetical protein
VRPSAGFSNGIEPKADLGTDPVENQMCKRPALARVAYLLTRPINQPEALYSRDSAFKVKPLNWQLVVQSKTADNNGLRLRHGHSSRANVALSA